MHDPTAPSVLISSLSRKVPLAEAFAAGLRDVGAAGRGGRLWGADADPDCVGRRFVDDFWEMPRLDELTPAALGEFCNANGIGLVIPTRDGELAFFSDARDELAAAGVFVPIGDPDGVEACLDKVGFAEHCAGAGVTAIPTTADAADLSGEPFAAERFVVKERRGMGSRAIAIDVDRDAALAHAATLHEPIFQPLTAGAEHSIDLYADRSGVVIEAVPRIRAQVVGGESVITETVEAPELVRDSIALAQELGIRGHAVLQAMVAPDGSAQFIECNARVGGASTLGFQAGVRTPEWSLREAAGETIEPALGEYQRGLRLVRYAADRFENS